MIKPVPDPVFIELTTRCNLSCAYCYAARSQKNCDLDTSLALKLITEIADMGTFGIVLSGGEPMLHPDITDIVSHAAQAGLAVGITTNGTLWSEVQLQQFSGKVSNLQISIDSSNSTTHDALRGQQGVFTKATNLVSAASEKGIHTTVSCVITQQNFFDIPALISLCINIGAKEFRILRMVPVGRGQEQTAQLISPKQVTRLKNILYNLGRENQGRLTVSWDSEFEPSRSEYCTAGKSILAIRPDGNVVPCSFLPGTKYILGSIKTNSLTEIWNSRALHEYRNNYGLIDERCRNCSIFSTCKGGCRAVREAAIWPPAIYCPYLGRGENNGFS